MSEEFDNYFKTKLRAHETAVPDNMWAAIEAKLGAEKKKRRLPFGYWYVPVAAVFLISIYPAVHLLTKRNTNSVASTEIVKIKPTSTDQTQPNLSNTLSNKIAVVPPIQSNNLPATKIQSTSSKIVMQNIYEPNEKDEIQSMYSPEEQVLSPFGHPMVDEVALRNLKIADVAPLKTAPIIGCPINSSGHEPSVFVEGYLSPAYTIRTITGGSADFRYRKDSAEKQVFSYGAGIRLSKSISNHLTLKSGIEFLETKEKFRLQREDGIRITTVVTVKNVNGVNIYDTISVQETQYKTTHTTNTYRSLSVPIILSYETGNENWRAAVSGGVIVNVFSKASGYSLDTSYKAVSISDKNNGIYKNGLGFSLYGSLALYKNILPNTEVFAEPYFQYQLSNLTSDKAGFNQKMHHLGVNLGIRYNLGNIRQRND